jgi:hypothetical protein
MWRRNGAIRQKRAFRAGVARGQREFHCGSRRPATSEKAGKYSVHCRQIEVAGFTQSWIVVWHFSRAGNVR